MLTQITPTFPSTTMIPTPSPVPSPTRPLTCTPTRPLTRPLTRGELRRAMDLRVRTGAAAAEAICARAEYLPPSDRELVRAVYQRGQSLAALGTAVGVPQKHLSRRLRKIVARINAPAFALVVVRAEAWEGRLAAVGRAVFVEGCNLRQASKHLNLTYHQVRAARDVIEGIVATLTSKEAA
ncbi:MAG: hypothetical protein ACK54T_06415 [bacterium]